MASHNVPSADDLELLSAYLDGELSDRERTTLEQRLAHETALQQTLDELRATVALLHDLPRLKAPRNFTLDPAVHGRAIPWWRRLFTLELTLQVAGAVGTLASVLVIVLALALSSVTEDDNGDASQVEYPAAAGESVALDSTAEALSWRRTATADALTWAARTAIAYDGEGLLQNTIEAQTLHYATNEAFALTLTAESFRITATAPVVGATQLPTAALMEGGEALAGADSGTDSGEDTEAGYVNTPAPESAPNVEAEGSGAITETADEPPMPALAESDTADADVFEFAPEQEEPGGDTFGPGGPSPAADVAAQPQAPADVTELPTSTAMPAGTPVATQAAEDETTTGVAQSAGAEESATETAAAASVDDTVDGQAQREHDDDDEAEDTSGDDVGDTSTPEPAPPVIAFADDDGMDEAADTGIAIDGAAPDDATQTNALGRTATPLATPTQLAEVALVATEEIQAAVGIQPAEQQASTSAEKRVAAEEGVSSSWLIGLGIALFVVSVVVFVLGRRRARHA